MKRFNEFLDKLLFWACSGLMLAMVTLIFAQVIARYVFTNSLTWSEELGRFIFVWMSFIGMAVAFRADRHVALDLLLRHLGPAKQRLLNTFNNLCILVFALAVAWSGFKLMAMAMRQFSPAMKVSMADVYIIMPIGGLLLAYFVILKLIEAVKSRGEKQ
ncbi:MAG: TRAP transporter small permease [Methylobacteriaceae bacterium]|jgi:TRAP-type C4-dicarboxylate transport system permease small subunit|nr:TRAP transporter small permease [Methylobacteriaceae bacterium]